MKAIYVVIGNTGEYGDYSEWNAMAFADEDKALAQAHTYNEILRKHKAHRSDQTGRDLIPYEAREAAEEELEQIDPRVRTDYTGADYEVRTITFVE